MTDSGDFPSDPAIRDTIASFLPRQTLPSYPASTSIASDFAVIFADIIGFNALTEALSQSGPDGLERLTDLVNRYFGRLIDRIYDAGGDILHFAGDALTAVWPVDAKHDLVDQIQQAVATALLLRIDADQEIDDTQLELRIALSAGPLKLLQIGGALERWELLSMGLPLVNAGEW